VNRSQPRVAVVGSGLAAHVAAGMLSEVGIDTALHAGEAPGLFGIWNGIGAVFGPPSPMPGDSAGAVEQRARETRPFVARRANRWRRLLERRGSFHPFRRLALDFDDVDSTVGEALTYLPSSAVARARNGTVIPGPHGHPAAPDVVAPSLLPLDVDAGDRIGLVRCRDLNGWDADATARQLDRAAELDALAVDSELFDGAPPGHGVRVARWLVGRVDREARALPTACSKLADRHGLDRLILPPILGQTLEARVEFRETLDAAVDADIAEFPPSRDPVFGWRLYRACRAACEASGVALLPAANSVDVTDRRAIGLSDSDGDEYPCDAVVLATGSWFGGGMPGEAPMVEALTGAPVWLDGAPMTGDASAYPPDYLGDLPWDDHDLFRAGVQIDATARALDRDGAPFDNVFAAGRLLAGFNPFHDGCSFGVELVTGLAAARHAAEAVGDTSEFLETP